MLYRSCGSQVHSRDHSEPPSELCSPGLRGLAGPSAPMRRQAERRGCAHLRRCRRGSRRARRAGCRFLPAARHQDSGQAGRAGVGRRCGRWLRHRSRVRGRAVSHRSSDCPGVRRRRSGNRWIRTRRGMQRRRLCDQVSNWRRQSQLSLGQDLRAAQQSYQVAVRLPLALRPIPSHQPADRPRTSDRDARRLHLAQSQEGSSRRFDRTRRERQCAGPRRWREVSACRRVWRAGRGQSRRQNRGLWNRTRPRSGRPNAGRRPWRRGSLSFSMPPVRAAWIRRRPLR